MKLGHTVAAAAIAALVCSAGGAGAEGPSHAESGTMEDMGHGGMTDAELAQPDGGDGAADPAASASPATEAYRHANYVMHEAMDVEFTGDADIDFVRGMIGHHQGAIDMARVVLEYGEDPDLRQLAEEIIEAQEAEIAFMQAWLAEHAE